jgi:hypothetical protein
MGYSRWPGARGRDEPGPYLFCWAEPNRVWHGGGTKSSPSKKGRGRDRASCRSASPTGHRRLAAQVGIALHADPRPSSPSLILMHIRRCLSATGSTTRWEVIIPSRRQAHELQQIHAEKRISQRLFRNLTIRRIYINRRSKHTLPPSSHHHDVA